MKISYPIPLISDYDEIVFSDGCKIRRMEEEQLAKLLGITNPTYDEKGWLRSWTAVPGAVYDMDVPASIFLRISPMMSSRHVFETEEGKHDPRLLNYALKLIENTVSGVVLGMTEGHGIVSAFPSPHYGNGLMRVDEGKKGRLIWIYESLLSTWQNDKRLQLMVEYFFDALSDHGQRDESRLISLVTALEMLYLPGGKGELNFRFALRIANLLRESPIKKQEEFQKVKELYDLRSRIVHGDDRVANLKVHLASAENIARESLLKYIVDRSMFTEEALNHVCMR
jgi:hypothetical protein